MPADTNAQFDERDTPDTNATNAFQGPLEGELTASGAWAHVLDELQGGGGTIGTQLAAVDWNGDLETDLAVGRNPSSNAEDLSELWLVSGPLTTGTSRPDARIQTSEITPDVDADYFAYHCMTSGDLDGDGLDDLVVGAPYDSTRAELSGAVYVLFGYGLQELAP